MKRYTIISKGEYYIGDICYVLSDEVYDNFWGNQKHFEDGSFLEPNSQCSFATVSTLYGDGTYKDQYGKTYSVDAGNIGIVPIELCEKLEFIEDERICEFVGEVHISVDNTGLIEIFEGNEKEPVIIIDTSCESEEYEPEDDREYYFYAEEPEDNWNDGGSAYDDDDEDEEWNF